MREILYVEEYTFEDCGTLGGRSFIGAGTEYQVLENTAPENMMANILFDDLRRADKNFDIASIGDYISAWNLQEYAILVRTFQEQLLICI